MGDYQNDVAVARANYITIRRQEVQNSIVNYKSSSSTTSDSAIWTFRSTGCDVVSIVTTTIPIKNGAMKDIRLHNKEMRRIRPPQPRAPGKVAPGNPLEVSEKLGGDDEKARLKNSLMLRKERDAFMHKLEASRSVRTAIERHATTYIQKVYRGRYARQRLPAIREICLQRRAAHDAVGAVMAEHAPQMTRTGMQHRNKYSVKRDRSAQIIQCCFRQYISRRVFRNRIFERAHVRRRRAVLVIQQMARTTSAKARVQLIRLRAYLSHTRKSAIMIQKHVRRLFARRLVRKRRYKLHWLAARLIQGWYRTKKAKVKSLKIKQILIQRKLWLGAEGMQCLVRRKIARCRVNRIRLRRLFLYLFASATTIQSMIRKFLAKCRMRNVRQTKAAAAAAAKKAREAEQAKEQALAELLEARQLLDGANIFSQAQAGNAVTVEDIFLGKLSDEKHEPTEVDANNDTVLTIAAAAGFMDIARKCFQWGFDFNHRNGSGMTALMLAVQGSHLELVQYILAPPVKFKLDRFTEADAAFLLVHTLDVQTQHRLYTPGHVVKMDLFKALMSQTLPVTGKDMITGSTPMHAACGLGDIETFRLILKAKGKHDLIDDVGQLPLHRACTSSIELVKMLLGVDSSAGILMPASKRAPILLIKDVDGKDCRLNAALYNQKATLELCQEIIKANREVYNASRKVKEEVGWTPDDFQAILRLARNGDKSIVCFTYIMECGFDPLWPQPETGVTVMMEACLHGQLEFIDHLMSLKLDFLSVADKSGQTAMHYAAQCASETVVAHLLSHENSSVCKITEYALKLQDAAGNTPLHTAAAKGIVLKVDLLAPNGMPEALATKDKKGLTPLAMAANAGNTEMMSFFLSLDASATDLDNDGNSILWHMFHPAKQASGGVRPVASELRTKLGCDAKLSKAARDGIAERLAAEINVIVDLVKGGCSLYRSATITTEELLASPYKKQREPDAPLSTGDLAPYCPGDLLVHELGFDTFRGVIEFCSASDCWRLLLSSIRFDCGAGKAFVALFEAGIADRLAGVTPLRKEMSKSTVSQLVGNVMFGGLSAAGWCIRLGSSNLLQRLYKKGLSPTAAADVRGDSCLHIIARYGTIAMVDVTVSDETVIIEGLNRYGNSALMEAAKMGNFHIAKRLIACYASARRGLNGRYWGWLLALARKQESVESNLQTGRIGEDDNTYFACPDPCWYEQAMDTSVVSQRRGK